MSSLGSRNRTRKNQRCSELSIGNKVNLRKILLIGLTLCMVNCGIFAFCFEASASSVTDIKQYPTSGYSADSNAPTTGSIGMIYTYCPDLANNTYSFLTVQSSLLVVTVISPSWLSFDHLNDQFEGTPTECGSYTVDIQAEQLVDNDLQTWNVATWTITVSQAVVFQSSAPTMTIAQGSEFSYTPLVTPNGSTLSMTSGPTWLSLHDGILSGIPETSGTYSVTLTASYNHDSYAMTTQAIGSQSCLPVTLQHTYHCR